MQGRGQRIGSPPLRATGWNFGQRFSGKGKQIARFMSRARIKQHGTPGRNHGFGKRIIQAYAQTDDQGGVFAGCSDKIEHIAFGGKQAKGRAGRIGQAARFFDDNLFHVAL